MGWKKNTPGCNASGSCGCATCSICTGDGCGFFVDTGTADLTVPGQITTTSNPSRVLTTSEDTSGGTAVQASVDFTSTTNGEILRLILKYKDSSNYWWAQVQAGTSGTLSLRKRVAGTDTTLASSSIVNPVGTTYTLTFCYGGGGVSATLYEGTSILRTITSITTTSITDGPKAGVAQASATTGTVFTNFVYEYGLETTLHDPCDRCYRACNFADDDFNRADSSSLGANWTVVSGTWEIKTNKLKTASSNALVVNTNVPTSGVGLAVITSPETGSLYGFSRLILGYVDSNNYYYAEGKEASVSVGSPFRIVQRSGGTDTVLTEILGQYRLWYFCYQPQFNRLTAGSDLGGYIVADSVPAITSTVCGIGTGTLTPASISFDYCNINYTGTGAWSSLTSAACQECEGCPTCTGINTGLPDVEVVIAGLGNNSCGSCTTFNTTYQLRYYGAVHNTNHCVWIYKFPSTTCGFKYLTAVSRGLGDWWVVLSEVYYADAFTSTNHGIVWSVAGQPNNCVSGTYSATLDTGQSFDIGTAPCTTAGSTATITIPY